MKVYKGHLSTFLHSAALYDGQKIVPTKVRSKPFVIPNNNPSTWYVDNLRIIITEYVYKYKK